MAKDELTNIKNEIAKCKKEMKKLEPYINENAAFAQNYNRILIRKAILVDKYKKIISKNFRMQKLVTLLDFRKPKLICDYFQNM